MILKLQHVSVFFIKPSSGSEFVPNKHNTQDTLRYKKLVQGRTSNKESNPITRTT